LSSEVPQSEQIHVELAPARVLAAHARHRRRFAVEVAELEDAALGSQSRCDKWTTADVLRHLCDVDAWMGALWRGEPLPFTGFDPNTTPHEFVVKARGVPDTQVRDDFVASCERMARDVEVSGPQRWALPSFSPVGAVPWWLSALHVFYDSWVHERDALLPLGIEPPVEESEATPVLAYSLALAGTFGREELDTTVCGVHLVAGRRPVTVEPVGTLQPDAGRVVDAVNGRANIEDVLPDVDPDIRRRLGALARFFGVAA
jgi:uncharacterized protein (TIGR03083 family)